MGQMQEREGIAAAGNSQADGACAQVFRNGAERRVKPA
jgi:hypothetical protein